MLVFYISLVTADSLHHAVHHFHPAQLPERREDIWFLADVRTLHEDVVFPERPCGDCQVGTLREPITDVHILHRLPSTAVAKTILHGASGSSTKFSWVLVDAEHGLISDHHYYEVSR